MKAPATSSFAVMLVGVALSATSPVGAQPFRSPRFTAAAALGWARGAGNTFHDAAIGAGVAAHVLELRLRAGSLIFLGGCDTIVPTKCEAGGGRYYEATFGLRLVDPVRTVGSWSIGVGSGRVATGGLWFVGGTVAREQPIGDRTAVRIELFGRHLFDDYYRGTWNEPHRQFGVRAGLAVWFTGGSR